MANAYMELWNVTTLKAFMVVAAVILAFNISPDYHITYPFSITTIFYAMLTGVIVVVAFVEMRFSMMEHGISGINFGAGVAMLVALAGIVFEIILLGLNYQFTDPTTNRYYSWYLFIGVFLLFLQGREEFIHHGQLKRLLGGA